MLLVAQGSCGEALVGSVWPRIVEKRRLCDTWLVSFSTTGVDSSALLADNVEMRTRSSLALNGDVEENLPLSKHISSSVGHLWTLVKNVNWNYKNPLTGFQITTLLPPNCTLELWVSPSRQPRSRRDCQRHLFQCNNLNLSSREMHHKTGQYFAHRTTESGSLHCQSSSLTDQSPLSSAYQRTPASRGLMHRKIQLTAPVSSSANCPTHLKTAIHLLKHQHQILTILNPVVCCMVSTERKIFSTFT